MSIAKIIYDRVKSGVLKITVELNGITLSSGSAFISDGKIVTCGHVYRGMPENSHIAFDFFEPTYHNDGKSFVFLKQVLDSSVVALSEEQALDYCVLDLPIPVGNRHNFLLSDVPVSIGEPVFALGYPYEQKHLSIHAGIISSVYKSSVAEMLQLDMSINPSNSGGPLLQSDGIVCGVICRKATGLSAMFDKLIESFRQNQEILTAATRNGSIKLMGVDPLKLGSVIQTQMGEIAKEIKRSANVGIGYAIHSSELSNERCFQRA